MPYQTWNSVPSSRQAWLSRSGGVLEAGGNSASHRVPAVESLTTSKYQALCLANGTVAPKSVAWEAGFSEVQSAQFSARQTGPATLSSPQPGQVGRTCFRSPSACQCLKVHSLGGRESQLKYKSPWKGGSLGLLFRVVAKAPGNSLISQGGPRDLGNRKGAVWGPAPEKFPVTTPNSTEDQTLQRSPKPLLPRTEPPPLPALLRPLLSFKFILSEAVCPFGGFLRLCQNLFPCNFRPLIQMLPLGTFTLELILGVGL